MLAGNEEQLWNLQQTDATEGLTFGDCNAVLKVECCLLKSVTTVNSVKIKLSEKVNLSKFMREIVLAVILYTYFIPDVFVDIFWRYKHIQLLKQKSFNINIAKNNVQIQIPLLIPIINLEWPPEKFHNNPGKNDSGSYEINLPYYGGGSPEERLVWKYSTGTQSHMFSDRLLKDDAKATFNQAALDHGI